MYFIIIIITIYLFERITKVKVIEGEGKKTVEMFLTNIAWTDLQK